RAPRGRRGFRPAYHDARGEGWNVNHKRSSGCGARKRLRVPQRRCRKRLGPSTTPNPPKAEAPNRAWAVDFHFRATTDGRPVKIVSVVEEHIRTRPLRAFLSALGIAIGIAAMVAVVGISSSSQANFNALLAKLGTNMLTVSPGQTL